MSMFAPVYRPVRGQQSYVARQHQEARKRRKVAVEDLDVASSSSETSEPSSPAFVPVDRNDPYLVAGYSREKSLPPYPFPHAAVKSEKEQGALDEELFNLKPAVHQLNSEQRDTHLSKRQHLDNLTVLLHNCVNKHDWQRASRIMGLLLRSEYNGAIDLRRHERWAMAAEILMRRQQSLQAEPINGEPASSRRTDEVSSGLRAARQYYERLVLQYPHTSRTKDTFNAVTIYASLFNIWIYEVQQRSRLAREASESRPSSSSSFESHDDGTTKTRLTEIQEAESIGARLDELLLGPPYDTNMALLRLRAMVGSWLSDLYLMVAAHSTSESQLGHYERSSHNEKNRSEALLGRIAQLATR